MSPLQGALAEPERLARGLVSPIGLARVLVAVLMIIAPWPEVRGADEPRLAGIAGEKGAPVRDACSEESDSAFDPGEETIGPLKLGLEEKAVIAALGNPDRKSAPILEEATGDWVSTWTWRQLGVSTTMAAAGKGASGSIAFVAIEAPSPLTTARGIGIGSAAGEIEDAYPKNLWDRCMSSETQVIVGSVYFGLAFDIKAGKVAKISMGAFAE